MPGMATEICGTATYGKEGRQAPSSPRSSAEYPHSERPPQDITQNYGVRLAHRHDVRQRTGVFCEMKRVPIPGLYWPSRSRWTKNVVKPRGLSFVG